MLTDVIRRGAVSGVKGELIGPIQIGNSNNAAATALNPQKKIDRCQNGVLWSLHWQGTSSTTIAMNGYYSIDDGTTWNLGSQFGFSGTGSSHEPHASFFIDLDDYAHVVYRDRSDGKIYYRRGTPNISRTTFTWSGALLLSGSFVSPTIAVPDIIAHREGTGWKAHVVFSYASGNGVNRAYYISIDITNTAVLTTTPQFMLATHASFTHTYPSIDFNHNGDGKTVAGGTPHLYVGWSAGVTGSGNGIRFMKAIYSGGLWTWSSEREIDSTKKSEGGPWWLNTLFDGIRVIMVVVSLPSGDLILYERNAADTITTTRVLILNAIASNRLYYGSSTYDNNGDVYIFGAHGEKPDGAQDLVWHKWNRSTGILESQKVFDSSGLSIPYISVKRGFSNNRIEFIYADDLGLPCKVRFGGIK